jgi:hypothetical protein
MTSPVLPNIASNACECFSSPNAHLILHHDLGLDARHAEVSGLICQKCGQHWLRYFYENEAFEHSGRWYLGAISPQILSALDVQRAKTILETLPWYYYGGSYFEGRTGKASGKIRL